MFESLDLKIVHLTIGLLNALSPLSVHVQNDVVYGSGEARRADIYQPGGGDAHPVVVFFYGGGWRRGSKEQVAYIGAALARRGYVAVIPEYRHFPAAGLPDILADNAAAVAWTIRHAPEWGGDPRHVTVAGHSSGAWAATMLALDPQWLEQDGSSPSALAGVIGMSGPYAVSSLTEQEDRDVFDGTGPGMEPINHCSPGQPPMLLLAGAADEDVRPSVTAALADRARSFGDEVDAHTYPGLGHDQVLYALSLPFSLWYPVSRDFRPF